MATEAGSIRPRVGVASHPRRISGLNPVSCFNFPESDVSSPMKILLLSISVLALASCSALIPYDKDTAEEVTWVDIVGMPPTPE